MKSNLKEKSGITLIALVITIVVILILAAITISLAINGGIIDKAEKASRDTKNALAEENELVSGRIKIGDLWYDSIDDYMNNSPSSNQGEAVDFEELFKTVSKHPNQIETNDIGIAEDGSIVNLDLWNYGDSSDGYSIGSIGSCGYSGYDGDMVDGKIQGQIPMYIKRENETEYIPVTMLQGLFGYGEKSTELITAPKIPSTVTTLSYTFASCTSLTTAPAIPNGVTSMYETFAGCTSLTKAPVIPNSVTDMNQTFSGCTSLTTVPVISNSVTSMENTFFGCTSLTTVPAIPNSVTDMWSTFSGCTSLTKAPTIPNNVTFMGYTFDGCTSLTGTVTVNANPTYYDSCFANCATNDGCNLVLKGSSTKLNELLGTKSSNSHISIAQ